MPVSPRKGRGSRRRPGPGRRAWRRSGPRGSPDNRLFSRWMAVYESLPRSLPSRSASVAAGTAPLPSVKTTLRSAKSFARLGFRVLLRRAGRGRGRAGSAAQARSNSLSGVMESAGSNSVTALGVLRIDRNARQYRRPARSAFSRRCRSIKKCSQSVRRKRESGPC